MTNSTSRRLRVVESHVKKLLGPYFKKSLKWDPQGFVIESPQLQNKIVEASVQERSLKDFETNPKLPVTYVVSGNPDDVDARYFAGYLAQIHIQALGVNSVVRWVTTVGTFENPALKENPTLLIISNLTPRSSNLKFEKTRDLIEVHKNIPKIIVVAGEDPLSFAATRLHSPCHSIAYFGSQISTTFNGVI